MIRVCQGHVDGPSSSFTTRRMGVASGVLAGGMASLWPYLVDVVFPQGVFDVALLLCLVPSTVDLVDLHRDGLELG